MSEVLSFISSELRLDETNKSGAYDRTEILSFNNFSSELFAQLEKTNRKAKLSKKNRILVSNFNKFV